MNPDTLWIWIGVLAGGVIGVAGGLMGTYFSIRNTRGPEERAFMIQSALVVWAVLLIFFGLMLALPNPYRWFLWIPYSILLPLGIIHGNRRQQAIRQRESQDRSEVGKDQDQERDND